MPWSQSLPLGSNLTKPTTDVEVVGGTKTAAEVPVFTFDEPIQISATACEGVTRSIVFRTFTGTELINSEMNVGGDGRASITLPAGSVPVGEHYVEISGACPSVSTFGIYVNPAVKVVSAGGARPVSGATVTLLRADSADQPFELLAEGSDFLSPGNRANPALTTGNGHNGWNMRAGTYRYEATAAGCVDAADASQTTTVNGSAMVRAAATAVSHSGPSGGSRRKKSRAMKPPQMAPRTISGAQ